MLLRYAAIKRLLLDLKEVLHNPLPDVTALPLQDNLFLWHGSGGCPGQSVPGHPAATAQQLLSAFLVAQRG
jgi:hypothetical protein